MIYHNRCLLRRNNLSGPAAGPGQAGRNAKLAGSTAVVLPVTELPIPDLASLPAVAAQVASLLRDYSIVVFEGEMGAGKTTFIKALCRALGVADDVSSPTFALVNEYRSARNEPIYHFDFYRLDDAQEALNIGALEYFDSGYLCLIEWPSRVEVLLPPKRLLVTLTVTGPGSRLLRLEPQAE
jgi:tRNA threonylcarbamoyladenosine biosynthesis protein TsaE